MSSDTSFRTTVIVDLSVVCHQLYRRLSGIYDINEVQPKMFTKDSILAGKLSAVERALASTKDREAVARLNAERDNILTKQHTVGAIKANLAYMMSLDWLGDLKPSGEVDIILACDTKPYWRLTYLERPSVFLQAIDYQYDRGLCKRGMKAKWKKANRLRELLKVECPDISTGTPEEWEAYQNVINERNAIVEDIKISYKAGRKFPAPGFTKLKEAIYAICDQQGWQRIAVQGYEADDIAAATVKLLSPHQKVILGTVDSDWLGLVNENTSWFCISGYFPRLRDSVKAINAWKEKKKELGVAEPTEIWKRKVHEGDDSDALPPGTPLEVIDLLNPPTEHRLWQNDYFIERLAVARNKMSDRGEVAANYLQYLGCRVVIDPFDWTQTCEWQRRGGSL